MSNKKQSWLEEDSVLEVLKSVFTVRGNDKKSFLLVALGVMGVGWIADSLLPFFQDSGVFIFNSLTGNSLETKFEESLLHAVVPLLLIFLVVWYLWRNRKRNLKESKVEMDVSTPHKGLILILSNFRNLNSDIFAARTCLEVSDAFDSSSFDTDSFIGGTNWGSIAFSVLFHAPVLRHCWVITTGSSEPEFETAKKMVRRFAPNADVKKSVIGDPNDIGEMAQEVVRIYRMAEESGLGTDEVIANIMGGTSAMSAGMVIAALRDDRSLECLNKQRNEPLSMEMLRNMESSRMLLSPTISLIQANRLSEV